MELLSCWSEQRGQDGLRKGGGGGIVPVLYAAIFLIKLICLYRLGKLSLSRFTPSLEKRSHDGGGEEAKSPARRWFGVSAAAIGLLPRLHPNRC